jgi:hypothetical protein
LQSDIRKIDLRSATLTAPSRSNRSPDEPLEIRAENDGPTRVIADGEIVAEAVVAPPLAP